MSISFFTFHTKVSLLGMFASRLKWHISRCCPQLRLFFFMTLTFMTCVLKLHFMFCMFVWKKSLSDKNDFMCMCMTWTCFTPLTSFSLSFLLFFYCKRTFLRMLCTWKSEWDIFDTVLEFVSFHLFFSSHMTWLLCFLVFLPDLTWLLRNTITDYSVIPYNLCLDDDYLSVVFVAVLLLLSLYCIVSSLPSQEFCSVQKFIYLLFSLSSL